MFFRRLPVLAPLLLFMLGCPADNRGKDKEDKPAVDDGITLQLVKSKDWPDVIKSFKGKIVVVDVWADTCIPCKENFPHHVDMHKQHAKDGVQCVSVTLDPPEKKDVALKFLKTVGATFPNYLIDDKISEAQKALDVYSPPVYYVFDRTSTQVGRFEPGDPNKNVPDSYKDVEKLVQKLIEQK